MPSRYIAFAALAFLSVTGGWAQPALEWQRSLGGSASDKASSVQQTADGGYVIAGATSSTNGNVSGYHGGLSDVWIVKLDASGALQWQHPFGGSGSDYANDVQLTSDGGMIVAATTESTDGDVSGGHGMADMWVLKLDATGQLQWQRCFGGSGTDDAYAIRQTSDGGYAVAGESASVDGDASGGHGSFDYWMVKLDADGALQWQRMLGGSMYETAYAMDTTPDGGYVLAGASASSDGDVGTNQGSTDCWIVKLDSDGALQWQKPFGGSDSDGATFIQPTHEGGYIVSGATSSNDGDIPNYHGGGSDAWVLMLDDDGTLLWQRTFGGTGAESSSCIRQVANGNYVLCGYTSSSDGDVTGNHGGLGDGWMMGLDTAGSLLWQEALGGSGNDGFGKLQQTTDGGFILAGASDSHNGDVTGNHGDLDMWVVKLGADHTGVDDLANDIVFTVFPDPCTTEVQVQFDLLPAAKLRAELFDATGKLVKKLWEGAMYPTTLQTYSTADLAPGLYQLRLSTSERIWIKRLIKH